MDNTKLVLTINKRLISEWFREQWKKTRQDIKSVA